MPTGISDICDYNTLYSAYSRLKNEGDRTASAKNSKAIFGQNIDIDGDGTAELWEFMQKANETHNKSIFNEINPLKSIGNNNDPQISDDNPINLVLSVESEITGKEKTAYAHALISSIIVAAKEKIGEDTRPVEKLQKLFCIIRNDFHIHSEDGLFQISEGLTKESKAANCVLGSYIYIAVAHEMGWPLYYVSSERHAFVYWKTEEGGYFGFETTNGGGVSAKASNLIRREAKFALSAGVNRLIADVFNNRGLAYDMKGEKDKAIDDYNVAINLKTDDPDSYNNRGVAYDEEGKFDLAIKDYNTAIELSGAEPDFYGNRGFAYFESGLYDKAIDDYSVAIKLNPDESDTYKHRGDAYYELGKYKLADNDFETARKLSK
jgi:tetratricopeptide (TPR) repeat protein